MIFRLLTVFSLILASPHQSFSADEVCHIIKRPKAPRCRPELGTEVMQKNAVITSIALVNKLDDIEASEAKLGHDFKTAIIARQGTDMSGLKVLRDFNPQGQSLSVEEITKEASFSAGISDQKNISKGIEDYVEPSRTLKYSHISIAVKNHPISEPQNRWIMFHLLFDCESTETELHRVDIEYFFYDFLKSYQAQILVPNQNVQDNLHNMLTPGMGDFSWPLKSSCYNALSMYDDPDEQNSNQWVLEMLAAAAFGPEKYKTRQAVQKLLKETNYSPTKVLASGKYAMISLPFVGSFLPIFIHTEKQKYIANFQVAEVVSALSVEEYLSRNKLLLKKVEVDQSPVLIFGNSSKK